ncbi:hypothetical protein [Sphingobacterium suaedae]|uniref:Uncharacterized protein n=1 Tax=Sphingobacterium suaedae TaxID=1686402 RepID=A0ABW5KPA2_9SPHI
MKQLILVDHITIGDFGFHGYLTEMVDGNIGFGIFVDRLKRPLLWFIQLPNNRIQLCLDDDLATYIRKKASADKAEREHNFRLFLYFVRENERKAAYMAFKGKQMEHLTTSKHLVALRKMYLAD